MPTTTPATRASRLRVEATLLGRVLAGQDASLSAQIAGMTGAERTIAARCWKGRGTVPCANNGSVMDTRHALGQPADEEDGPSVFRPERHGEDVRRR